jgi:general secretion pathway protein D
MVKSEVLAGLIREQERKSSTNIPFLGRLPVLGPLFSSRSKDKSRSEILLSITPKIIRRNTERLNYANAFDSVPRNYISFKQQSKLSSSIQGTEVSGSSSDNPPPSAYIPVPPPQSVAQPQSTSENIINLNVPEQIISTDPLNVLVEAQSVAKAQSILIKFESSPLIYLMFD